MLIDAWDNFDLAISGFLIAELEVGMRLLSKWMVFMRMLAA